MMPTAVPCRPQPRNPNDQAAVALGRLTNQTTSITAPTREAWNVMGLLQYLRRHPQLDAQTREVVERFGRQIQDNICDDPVLYALAEAGWHPRRPRNHCRACTTTRRIWKPPVVRRFWSIRQQHR